MKYEELLTPKKIDIPIEFVRLKPYDEIIFCDSFERKVAFEIAESFDDAIMKKVIDIAKEQGYTDLCLINKEFVVEALKKEIERRIEK